MSTSTSLPSDVFCTGPVPPHALFSTRCSTTSYTTPTCNSWKAITRGRLHHHPPDQVLQIESVPSPNPNSVALFPEVGLFCIYKIPFLTLSASSMASNPSENPYSGSNFPASGFSAPLQSHTGHLCKHEISILLRIAAALMLRARGA